MNQKLRKTCFLGSILLFLLLAFLVTLKLTTHVDEAVSKLFIELRNPGLTMFFKQITDFGYVQVLVILIAVILIVFHKYRFAYILPIHVGICVIFNLLLNIISKYLVFKLLLFVYLHHLKFDYECKKINVSSILT